MQCLNSNQNAVNHCADWHGSVACVHASMVTRVGERSKKTTVIWGHGAPLLLIKFLPDYTGSIVAHWGLHIQSSRLSRVQSQVLGQVVGLHWTCCGKGRSLLTNCKVNSL